MSRPSNADERRRELLPVIAEAFSDLGYRRATTAEIAARCGVQENILYRHWADKKAMFLAAIDFLFERRLGTWKSILDETADENSRADRLIELTAKNLGEQGLYRVIFTALGETHDPEIKSALKRLYRRYHDLVESEIAEHRQRRNSRRVAGNEDTAWALIGMVTFMNIAIDLELMGPRRRQQTFSTMAHFLLDGVPR